MIKQIKKGLWEFAFRKMVTSSSNFRPQIVCKPLYPFYSRKNVTDNSSLRHWYWAVQRLNSNMPESIKQILFKVNSEVSSKIYTSAGIEGKLD